MLLLATSAWIIYEAIQRLFYLNVKVEASIWSFIVMGTSIIIDFTRSRILYKAARKYNSQALEADALHFSTDIWSSSVVILGLIGLTDRTLCAWSGLDAQSRLWWRPWWWPSLSSTSVQRLGYRTISALLDTAPKGLAEKIEKVAAAVPGVVDAHAIRIRPSGAHTFIDMHVTMDGNMLLKDAHAATVVIEDAIMEVVPMADVTVHMEPADTKTNRLKRLKKNSKRLI